MKLSEDEQVLVMVMHHIISDGWSMGVLVQEVAQCYEAYIAGRTARLAELPIQYADYAYWQRNWLQGDLLHFQLDYWKRQLENIPEVLQLPTDRPRPALQTYNGAIKSCILPKNLSESLSKLSQQENVTLFMTLLAAFQTQLYRYTGQSDIVVGTPIANRNRVEIEGLIGFFVNTLALRSNLSGNISFLELLRKTRDIALGAYTHQDLPFEKLVEELQPQRHLSHTPIFQVMFTIQNTPMSSFDISGLSFHTFEVESVVAKFDLSLSFVETDNGLVEYWEYNTDLFDDVTVARMLGHCQTLLESIIANPTQQLAALPILTLVEQQQLVTWNDTDTDYAQNYCLHELFEAQVERTPDAIALIFHDQLVTYQELNARANQLAHYLQKFGVAPEAFVGICVERSIEMIVGLLGVLKAGGVYIPLDPNYPQDRLAFMIEDAGIELLLTQKHFIEKFSQLSGRAQTEIVCLESDWQIIDQEPSEKLTNNVLTNNPAYVIYTSGSTGKPKGVVISHNSICSRLYWGQLAQPFQVNDRTLQIASISFDASIWEIFTPLVAGAQLVIAPPEATQDIDYLCRIIVENKITVLQIVPSLLQMLLLTGDLQKSRDLQQILCGGEVLSNELQERIFESMQVELFNYYGPTETTIDATYWHCQRGSNTRTVPIGRPIGNIKTYILDKYLYPVAIGVAGELYVAGVGLARGYLNRPDLTADKFIPDPFSKHPGDRLYKTGDLVRYLPDGSIEFLGRVDDQIKIRGLRLELGEIEAVLTAHPDIHEAAVVVREGIPGEQCLVAYLVAKQQEVSSFSELRNYLKERLPEYMVPSAFVILNAMPLTPSGKIDRQALPLPDKMTTSFASPRNLIEEMITSIWSQVLKRENIGVHDNFFELGGHSLLAAQLIARLRSVFKIELPLRSLFESPTIAELANKIATTDLSEQNLPTVELLPISREQELPLSFVQQRFWFLDQLVPDNPAFNIPAAVHLKGILDVAILERSFNEIVRRHEVLRTNFVAVEGRPVQTINTTKRQTLSIVDLRHLPESVRTEKVKQLTIEEAQRPFNLAKDPLLRTTLLHLAEDEYVLLLTMHHIISDGWSAGVLVQELTQLYQAYSVDQPSPLSDLPIQYADFAYWQRQWLQGEVLATRLAYWKRQLGGNLPVLQLPTDRPRPPLQTSNGDNQLLILPKKLSQALKSLSQQESVTLFMLLLAVFKVLLNKYTGQDDIIVGSSIANRNRIETEQLIGLLINTLVLRTDLSGNPSFRELLNRVREMSLGAYANQDLPFEQLLEELRPSTDTSRPPVFQVAFQLQNFTLPTVQLSGLTLSPLTTENKTAKFDLSLSIMEIEDGLMVMMEYNTDLFEAATIKRMLQHYHILLEGVIDEPTAQLSKLPILTDIEQQQILVEWNNTDTHYQPNFCLHKRFEAQAEQTPNAVALVFEDRQLTYQELNQRANQLAHYLQKSGISREALVAICLERSPEMIISILAILKAGAAYLPLDPNYPSERLHFIMEDADTALLLSETSLIKLIPTQSQQVICLDTDWQMIACESKDNLPDTATVTDTAYVIYTSGSTGKPKGVLISHYNVDRLFQATEQWFQFNQYDAWTLFHSYAFDFSVWEIWGALLHGGRLVIVPYWMSRSPEEFYRLLCRERVTVLNQTPSAFRQLIRIEESINNSNELALRLVIFGGEALELQSLRPWFNRHGDQQPSLVNMYGITETTVHVTYRPLTIADLELASNSVIGGPIPDLQVYILDQYQQLLPIGVAGEMYIGGDGLARGYLNRAELTTARFVPNPFSSEAGARLYRSGDLARYLGNGDIEYLGRIDNQVKIRGFRIELGEIEAAICEHPSISEAVVVARDVTGEEKRLVAYLVVHSQASLSINELRVFLQQKLPDYMIPSVFVILESLPLTANGKVNYRALPAPDQARPELTKEFVTPRTPIEKELAKIWSELLGVEKVGIYDNFFELGGHSLLLTQLASWIRKDFRVEVPLRILFDTPTIVEMTKAILARQVKQENKAQLAQMLKELKQLSPEKVKAKLEKMGGSK
ncbi:MAG: amino acid adenylation domain-containing protein [Acidobacteriota bacterium]